MLTRCHLSYSSNYKKIVNGQGSAPEKLRLLADVFALGLRKQELCFVGTISADLNTLEAKSRIILETTIANTVRIFEIAFKQGRQEGSLSFKGSDEETAYAFFSFLLGTQISARALGGEKAFRTATEAVISAWES